jgi:hypothetical protein
VEATTVGVERSVANAVVEVKCWSEVQMTSVLKIVRVLHMRTCIIDEYHTRRESGAWITALRYHGLRTSAEDRRMLLGDLQAMICCVSTLGHRKSSYSRFVGGEVEDTDGSSESELDMYIIPSHVVWLMVVAFCSTFYRIMATSTRLQRYSTNSNGMRLNANDLDALLSRNSIGQLIAAYYVSRASKKKEDTRTHPRLGSIQPFWNVPGYP